jgi:hypothetical protein
MEMISIIYGLLFGLMTTVIYFKTKNSSIEKKFFIAAISGFSYGYIFWTLQEYLTYSEGGMMNQVQYILIFIIAVVFTVIGLKTKKLTYKKVFLICFFFILLSTYVSSIFS